MHGSSARTLNLNRPCSISPFPAYMGSGVCACVGAQSILQSVGCNRGVVVLVRRLVHLRVVQEAVEDVVERLRRWRGAERSAQVAI